MVRNQKNAQRETRLCLAEQADLYSLSFASLEYFLGAFILLTVGYLATQLSLRIRHASHVAKVAQQIVWRASALN